mgnify:CR=1 FL=1
MSGLIGKKIGMTQIFDDNGAAVPVTLIEAGPCFVTLIRSVEKDGYSAVQLGYEEVKPKRLTGGEIGHLKRANTIHVSCNNRDTTKTFLIFEFKSTA